jgi:predicted ATPase
MAARLPIRTPSPLVGRQGEVAALWNHFEVAKSGHAAIALVAGEPGIDKTHLLDIFAERATHDGAQVLRGGASEAAGMPPYLPFLEALGQHIRAITSLARKALLRARLQQTLCLCTKSTLIFDRCGWCDTRPSATCT